MSRIAAIMERFDARASIFVEALEFDAMEAAGHTEISEVKEQIASLALSGHEINLHIHPQWLGAVRSPDGTWQLNGPSWRMGDLDHATVTEVIRRGTTWLRDILHDSAPDFYCTAFRAGGWAIQPSICTINALREFGFKIESSVAPGKSYRRTEAWYDFRDAPHLPNWPVHLDVMSVGTGPVLEVPIAVGHVSPVRHLRSLVARKRHGEFAPKCSGSYEGRSKGLSRFLAIPDKLLGSERAMLDICSLPASMLAEVVEDWISKHADHSGPLPIVAIGHTKNFSRSAEHELARFLEWSKVNAKLAISSYAGWFSAASSLREPQP